MLVQFPKSVAILNFPRYPSNSLMLQLSKGLMSICEIESTAIAPACDTTSGKRSKPGLSRSLTLLFAAASGLAVANAYFAHPLLDVIADDLSLPRATIGFVVGATQLGYGLGLVLLVPVGIWSTGATSSSSSLSYRFWHCSASALLRQKRCSSRR